MDSPFDKFDLSDLPPEVQEVLKYGLATRTKMDEAHSEFTASMLRFQAALHLIPGGKIAAAMEAGSSQPGFHAVIQFYQETLPIMDRQSQVYMRIASLLTSSESQMSAAIRTLKESLK